MDDLDSAIEEYQKTEGMTDEELLTVYQAMMNIEKWGGIHNPPVGIEEFIESEHYMNKKDTIYTTIMPHLIELNIIDKYYEACLTGGIGVAKTTVALYTIAYQLYLLSLYKNPHQQFGNLDPSSEIEIVFQNMDATKAYEVDYKRFRHMIDSAPYFTKHFPYDRKIQTQMLFPNRIIVKPVSGSATATIGANVVGGMIDELNYMATVEDSKHVKGGDTEYDQAMALYNSINRRRKSRFMQPGGHIPGILCLASSTRYPGEFTDIKKEEAKTDKGIFVFHKRIWEIKPWDYTGDRFPVFIGDMSRKPRILEPREKLLESDMALVDYIPEELRIEFKRDIVNALREIGGHSTLSKSPFFVNIEAVSNCFNTTRSILSTTRADFVTTKVKYFPLRFQHTGELRCVHLDLAKSSDSAGIAMGYVDKFVRIDRGSGVFEVLPHIIMDFVLEIPPPPNGEINYATIRKLFIKLREAGIKINFITADTYQSTDSLQILEQQGFSTGHYSLDTKTEGYDILKSTIYDERLWTPKHDHLQKELLMLEYMAKKDKIDHSPGGSKDTADALAGVVRSLTMRRDIWHSHDQPITRMPVSIQAIMINAEQKERKQRDKGQDTQEEFT